MNASLIVFKKEVLEMARDRRVMINAFVMPIFIIFLFTYMFGFISKATGKEQKRTIAIVQQGMNNSFVDEMRKDKQVEIKEVVSLDEAKQFVAKGEAPLALAFSAGFDPSKPEAGSEVTVVYDDGDTGSELALNRFKQMVGESSVAMVKASLAERHLPPTILEPIKVTEVKASKSKGLGASMLSGILPYLIVLYAFTGGVAIVSDLVAGEKERGTLETLLISPADRRRIVRGKLGALCLACLCSALVAMTGVMLAPALGIPGSREVFPEGAHLSLNSVLAIVAVLIPLVGMFGGIMLMVSAHAKNMRECQSFLAILNLAILMPALMSSFIGYTEAGKSSWVKWTPVLNDGMMIRNALLNRFDWGGIAAAAVTSLVVATVALVAVDRMFQREQILSRT